MGMNSTYPNSFTPSSSLFVIYLAVGMEGGEDLILEALLWDLFGTKDDVNIVLIISTIEP